MASGLAFLLHLLEDAFLLAVSWMGTSLIAIIVVTVVVPGVRAVVRLWQQGWHGVKSLAKEYAKDTGAIIVGVWILLFAFAALHSIPAQIRAAADSIKPPVTPFRLTIPNIAGVYDKAPKIAHSRPPQQPNIGLELVYPREFAVYVFNDSKVLVNKARWWFVLFDLDQPSPNGNPKPLQIAQQFSDYIRTDSPVGPFAVIGDDSVRSQVRNGDRLFGAMAATCPDCKYVRAYYVYAVVGQGGWYSEIPQTSKRNTADWFALSVQIRSDPAVLQSLLVNRKVAIGSSNP
jgi:hypothetical protein